MDETPVFFDMVPERPFVSRGKKSVTIRTSGSERRHVTVVLNVAADGFILLPIINFKGKTNLTIKDIVATEGLSLLPRKKRGWINPFCLVGLKKDGRPILKKSKRS